MKRKVLLMSAFCLLLTIGARATDAIVWQGSQTFTGWSDVLNIDGSKLKEAKVDDVLHLSITTSPGAQLQLSWGNSWTCFEGLEHKSISGDYEMLLSAQDATRLRQGIHIKGVNFTLTAVTLRSNDGEYTTQSEHLFAWKDMLMSGATQGQACTIGLMPYGGAGWYWPEPIDLSSYGSIVIQLLQPAAEPLTVQLLYDDKGVKSQVIAPNATQCTLPLSSLHKNAYSLNIISEKAQTVSIGSVNLADKQGNTIPSAVGSLQEDSRKVISTHYYNAVGMRLPYPQTGINIVKTHVEEGQTLVRKVWK